MMTTNDAAPTPCQRRAFGVLALLAAAPLAGPGHRKLLVWLLCAIVLVISGLEAHGIFVLVWARASSAD